MSGPLRRVLEAIDEGALTPRELRRRTGLSDDLLRAALEQLQRMGALSPQPLAGCPPTGCGSCGLQTDACGPQLLTLSATRRA